MPTVLVHTLPVPVFQQSNTVFLAPSIALCALRRYAAADAFDTADFGFEGELTFSVTQ